MIPEDTVPQPKWESDWKQLQESQHIERSGLYSFVWDDDSSTNNKDICLDILHKESYEILEPLPSPQFGKIILLSSNSCVTIRSNSTPTTTTTARWKLQWVRGANTMPTKCISCTTCRKTFASVKAVQTHAQQFHSQPTQKKNHPQSLRVIYNDDTLAVIDKPQGMTVQGDKETLWKSDLLLSLAASSNISNAKDVFRKPRPVHRLDCATGGLLVIAKTRTAEAKLRQAFATRVCKKRYRALVWGELIIMEEGGRVCEEPVKGRSAKTEYKPLKCIPITRQGDAVPANVMTVVDLWPETGRKHQLRKHLQGLKHSIVGDLRYGGGRPQPDPYGSKLCLWAMEISFPHPVTGETVHCQLEDPDWLQYVIQYAQDGSENLMHS